MFTSREVLIDLRDIYEIKNIGSFDQRSIIDYIMISLSFYSDHRLLVADLRIKIEKLNVKEDRSVIKAETVKEQNKKQEDVNKINENAEHLMRGESAEDIRNVVMKLRRKLLVEYG